MSVVQVRNADISDFHQREMPANTVIADCSDFSELWTTIVQQILIIAIQGMSALRKWTAIVEIWRTMVAQNSGKSAMAVFAGIPRWWKSGMSALRTWTTILENCRPMVAQNSGNRQ